MSIRKTGRLASLVLVAGIAIAGLGPRWVVIPAPAAEVRHAQTTTLVERTSITERRDVTTEALFALPVPAVLVVVLLPFFVAPRTIRRQLRIVLRRVRAPGLLLETTISTAEGSSSWQSLRNGAATSGRRPSLVTIAV